MKGFGSERSFTALILFCALLTNCGETPPPVEKGGGQGASLVSEHDLFHDVALDVGVDFAHRDGRSGQRFYVETSASGGGFFDYDSDGDLDLYLVNGARTPGSPFRDNPRNALYENQNGRFIEVTAKAGVADEGYGMGFCVGDVNADGRLDFLVTNHGRDRLYFSRGALGFEEVGDKVGIIGERWGTNCAFADLDADGDLDLYVANYVDFAYDRNPRCGDAVRDAWSYCRPTAFEGQADQLYIQQGPGEDGLPLFREESVRRGIAQGRDEKGYGVLISDVDADGDPDIAVANDGTPNRLYLNDGQGFFSDQAVPSGLAVNREGTAEAGMGMDWGDVDGDGHPDLIVTNYSFETHTLYRNLGDLFFEDITREAGLASPSYLPVGWGVSFFDYDNDGDLDLAIANGHVLDTIDLFEDGVGYAQANSLFENEGNGRFREVSAEAGAAFQVARVSRALAVGDWNNDGRLDLLITNTNDHVDLLENRTRNNNHWLGLSLSGSTRNPAAIGARVFLRCGENLVGRREVRSGGSFLAQSDLRLHFGLGSCTGPVEVSIHWPGDPEQDNHVQYERFDEVDRYVDVLYE